MCKFFIFYVTSSLPSFLPLIMRITVTVLFLLGITILDARGEPIGKTEEESDEALLDCASQENTLGCLGTRLARSMDRIEMQVTGKRSETPMSVVIEQAGNFVAELVDDIQNPGRADQVDETSQFGEHEEGRARRKKKKKQLQKLLGLAMLFKAKLSLLLQLISTHFQLKFFFIAIATLVINATKFWLDLKNAKPSKVIYYEHAQHQHHYDHDDHDHNYWGRSSSNDSPQDLPYSAYAPKN